MHITESRNTLATYFISPIIFLDQLKVLVTDVIGTITTLENKNLIFQEKLKFCLASVNIRRKTEYTFLKPMQIKCIKSALETDSLVFYRLAMESL